MVSGERFFTIKTKDEVTDLFADLEEHPYKDEWRVNIGSFDVLENLERELDRHQNSEKTGKKEREQNYTIRKLCVSFDPDLKIEKYKDRGKLNSFLRALSGFVNDFSIPELELTLPLFSETVIPHPTPKQPYHGAWDRSCQSFGKSYDGEDKLVRFPVYCDNIFKNLETSKLEKLTLGNMDFRNSFTPRYFPQSLKHLDLSGCAIFYNELRYLIDALCTPDPKADSTIKRDFPYFPNLPNLETLILDGIPSLHLDYRDRSVRPKRMARELTGKLHHMLELRPLLYLSLKGCEIENLLRNDSGWLTFRGLLERCDPDKALESFEEALKSYTELRDPKMECFRKILSDYESKEISTLSQCFDSLLLSSRSELEGAASRIEKINDPKCKRAAAAWAEQRGKYLKEPNSYEQASVIPQENGDGNEKYQQIAFLYLASLIGKTSKVPEQEKQSKGIEERLQTSVASKKRDNVFEKTKGTRACP